MLPLLLYFVLPFAVGIVLAFSRKGNLILWSAWLLAGALSVYQYLTIDETAQRPAVGFASLIAFASFWFLLVGALVYFIRRIKAVPDVSLTRWAGAAIVSAPLFATVLVSWVQR